MKLYAIRNVTRYSFAVTFVCLILFCLNASAKENVPTGVKFYPDVFRSGNKGDNWFMTWAADGDVYTSMCDGRGWLVENEELPNWHNNQIIRLSGTPGDKLFRGTPLEGAPDYSRSGQSDIINIENRPEGDHLQNHPKSKIARKTWTWYAYGIVSIDRNLYQFISHTGVKNGSFGWFDGVQLIWRPKGEKDWKRWNGSSAHDKDRWLVGRGGNRLLFHNEPNHAFSFISVVQYGQDYRENKDGYVYLYSPNGRKEAHRLNLARVKKEHILDRTKWEYFVRHTGDGGAKWAVNDINKRGDVHLFPDGWGFYSWSPSVVWNKKIGLFIMACAGTQRPGTGDPMDTYMHYETGALKFLWAENPWGPWHEFYYDEAWSGDHKDNRLYLPQISPKWISGDGKSMYLIYSDAGYSYGKNYRWNCQKFTILFGDIDEKAMKADFSNTLNGHPTRLLKKKVKIIIDTDFGDDGDDLAALCILHHMADLGEVEILAIGQSNSRWDAPGAIDVINTYYGRPDIPIGQVKYKTHEGNQYSEFLVKHYKYDLDLDNVPSAVEVYRRALVKAPDKSVKFVVVGFKTNMRDLLKSKPDSISPLSGIELVKKKVILVSDMGGGYPSNGGEFNFKMVSDATKYYVEHWPTPMIFSGLGTGSISVGTRVRKIDTPVGRALDEKLTHGWKPGEKSQAGFNLAAVLVAARGADRYFNTKSGCNKVDANGANTFDYDHDCGHQHVDSRNRKISYEEIGEMFEEMMLAGPKNPVGMGSYNMDSHNVQRYVEEKGCARNEGDIQINPGGPYPISYGALVPKASECTNLLVPVCVSSSHIAYGSIRMEPVFMVLGQSAATAAVFAIDGNINVQDVDYSRLRAHLLADGQVLELP